MNYQLIRDSFDALTPHAEDFVNTFYQFLFEDYPASQKLFENVDLNKQKKQFLAGLSLVITNWEDKNTVRQSLLELGARHNDYGVLPEHYPLAGETLIKTLKYFFAEDWNKEAEDSWLSLYKEVSRFMVKGMRKKTIKKNIKESEGSLVELTRNLAEEIFKDALIEQEDKFYDLARTKAKQLLEQAIEDEASSVKKQILKKVG